ncbi:condensation domain-containing protein [Dactylosporangium sp. NPDC051484]|uniref:condensation domain-containing protein n=1 Tax=Dactylosporangium sp. NPDC051484 TaxID=3154942 RepID=UPI00344FF610
MERITVPFTGDGAGRGELTWGQQQVWRAMVEVDTSMSMGGVVPVLDARTVEDFAGELRFFMSRYPAMRSLLRIAPGGATTQEVLGSGEAFLEVHTAASADAAGALAAEVYAGWKARNFDYAHEWPIRMAVVRAGEGGPVTHVVVMICHIAADGSGLATMVRELAERDTIGPHPATGPLELAATQRAAGRHTDNAMRYWEAQLRVIEPQRFAGYAEPEGARFRQVVWRSPAMYLASERLAAELSVDAAPVLLAAYGVAFARVVGGGPLASQVIVSNRFRPGLADVVSPLAQNGLVVLDARGITAAEAVSQARQASMSASKYAYYDPGTRLALIDRIGKERGEPIDLAVFYNDRRISVRPPAEAPDEAATLAARPATELVSETSMSFFNEKLMINIDDVPGTVQITTEVDTAYLPIEDLRRLLWQMEDFTVAAALDPGAPTV